MSFKKEHIISLIKKVVTTDLNNLNNNQTMIKLISGTIAQESQFGTYLKQLGNGPALGICQTELVTFNDLLNRYGKFFKIIETFKFEQLEWDLRASIIMCRVKYYSVPGFPEDSLQGIANYWKKYYNTIYGSGTIEEFIKNYSKYVGNYNAKV
jgi:hypothetical protein